MNKKETDCRDFDASHCSAACLVHDLDEANRACSKCGMPERTYFAMQKPGLRETAFPELVEADKPICPHCERPFRETDKEYTTINCGCGWKFEVQRVYVSRPLEQRN